MSAPRRPNDKAVDGLPVLLLATACAFAVAPLYLVQPLLQQLESDFNLAAAGLVVTATQAGYATGLFLIVPMADRAGSTKLVSVLTIANMVAGICCALAPNYVALCFASFLLGQSSVSAQIIIPVATGHVPPAARAEFLGCLISGMSVGPLFSRLLSGWVGTTLDWRNVFLLTVLSNTIVFGCVTLAMPRQSVISRLAWVGLLSSLAHLFRASARLRRASASAGAMFGALSAVWAALGTLLSQPPFSFSPASIGALGLVGITSIMSAPVSGKLVGRYGPAGVLKAAVGLACLAFVLLFVDQSLLGILISLCIIDLANRVSLVANQSRIQEIDEEARARINTIFMTSYFVGGALGAAAATFVVSLGGWRGLSVAGLTFSLFALAEVAYPQRSR